MGHFLEAFVLGNSAILTNLGMSIATFPRSSAPVLHDLGRLQQRLSWDGPPELLGGLAASTRLVNPTPARQT